MVFRKNHVMHNFGFDPIMDDDAQIENAIKKIDKTFDFIMILNYMDEYLVLLADMLYWSLAGVSSVVLNQRFFSKNKQIKSSTD